VTDDDEPIESTDDLLTTTQAALFLTVKPGTLSVWRATNRVRQPRFIRVGRAVRYRRSDLLKFLASQTVEAAPRSEPKQL